MADIVQHQLNRSVAAGGTTLGQTPVAVLPVLNELRGALLRVYSSKDMVIRIECEPAIAFLGDRGDLLELIGNIADNACKYCGSVVTAAARTVVGVSNRISIVVDDDGPGVPDDAHERILERGVRVDESASGHGLGLSMARDIVAQYRGELAVSKSALGGARFAITLPGTQTTEAR
jgi:two-component system sensor histidine kinase PhoQ